MKANSAPNSSFPAELEGIWVTTKEDNLGGRAGGEILTHGQKDKLCADLLKTPSTPHSFEGVLVLKGTSMIEWDGKCSVQGGFTVLGGRYSTRWSCKGEHGTNRGTVSFELRKTDANTSLVKKTTFSKGGRFTNVYDERCR